MRKLYMLTLSTSDHSTLFVILEDPQINNGYISGTKVGQFIALDMNGIPMFKGIPAVEFMAGGAPWTLEEFKGDLS